MLAYYSLICKCSSLRACISLTLPRYSEQEGPEYIINIVISFDLLLLVPSST